MAIRKPKAPSKRKKTRRPVSVYDAVAGRVGYEGFLANPEPSKYRDTASSSTTAVPPEEVLFRRSKAPVRYEEDDIYFANHCLHNQALPDSDLLKTLHAYASNFYAARDEDGDGTGFRSLDETALLAIGVLLEETAAQAVEETGILQVSATDQRQASPQPP